MNTAKKTMIAGTLAVAIPALTFASGGMRGFGFSGFQSGSGTFSLPTSVQSALTASGIAIPTQDEFKAHQEAMTKVHDAISKLSDADKTALEKLREDAQKAERDFLRSKGVPFPDEAEIAKFRTFQEKMHDVMKNNYGKNGKGIGMVKGWGWRGHQKAVTQ